MSLGMTTGMNMATPSSYSNDQQDVVSFLSNPASYGPGVDHVNMVKTHISLVFFAGNRVLKLKRAVHFPYVDFSTTDKRRCACNAELTLNRRTAPSLYLEIRRIGRTRDGSLGWATSGPALDWVVVMRRFDQAQLFATLATEGKLNPSLMRDLVDHVAAFHAVAECYLDRGGAAAFASVEATNDQCLRGLQDGFFELSHVDRLHAQSREQLLLVSDLLYARRASGKVRHCHGDLHLRNICVLEGKPTLFDCLEFSKDLAVIDVLYDIAFLVMDLEHRGLRDLANLAANRYFDMSTEEDGLAALPLFLSLRAAIRAHVTATMVDCVGRTNEVDDHISEARRYLDLARAFLSPPPRRLVAIGGLSGTGKSTMAATVAPLLGARPGARILRSDVIRKRLWGVSPETPLPAPAYSPEMSRRVYETIRSKAAAAIRAGYCVVIDAVSLDENERRSFAVVAEQAGVPFSGVWLSAPREAMAARLDARRNDASDASLEVLQQQLKCDPGQIDWVRVEVGGDRDTAFATVRRAVGLPRG